MTTTTEQPPRLEQPRRNPATRPSSTGRASVPTPPAEPIPSPVDALIGKWARWALAALVGAGVWAIAAWALFLR